MIKKLKNKPCTRNWSPRLKIKGQRSLKQNGEEGAAHLAQVKYESSRRKYRAGEGGGSGRQVHETGNRMQLTKGSSCDLTSPDLLWELSPLELKKCSRNGSCREPLLCLVGGGSNSVATTPTESRRELLWVCERDRQGMYNDLVAKE